MKKLLALILVLGLSSATYAADQQQQVAKQAEAMPAAPQEIKKISGTVTDIKNSVIFKLKDDQGTEHTVRLAQIGTPFLNKPHGPESLQALKDLIANKKVECEIVQTDRLGKQIAKVTCDKKSVQEEMVKAGNAWVSKKYGTPELVALQDKAKEEKKGLWALSDKPAVGLGTKGMAVNVKKGV